MKDNFEIRSKTAKLFPNMSVDDMPTSKEECTKLMGETINEKLQDIAQDKPVNLRNKTAEDIMNKVNEMNQENYLQERRISARAQTLFNFHLVSGGILECLSEAEFLESKTGSNLTGLTKDLMDDKEEFLEVLKDLYADYSEEIDPWINSIIVYGLFMSNKIGQRFIENKKKTLKGESVKSKIKLSEVLGFSESVVQLPQPVSQQPVVVQHTISQSDNIRPE